MGSDLPNLSPQARTAGLPPADRVHAYLLCSGKTRLSRSRGTGRLTALAIRSSPSTSPVPPRRVLTPSARHLIPPRIPALRFPASSTTPQPRPPWGPPSRPTHSAGPGVMSLPVDRQLGHRPPRARSVSTPRIPDCSPSGVPPPPPAQCPSQSCHVTGSTKQQGSAETRRRRRLRGSAAGGARERRSRKARSPRARREPTIGSAPCAAPPILGLLSRPPSHRAPTLAGVIAPPPKERWGRVLPKLIEAGAVAMQSVDLGHNYFCLLSSPARILRGCTGASEGQDTRSLKKFRQGVLWVWMVLR